MKKLILALSIILFSFITDLYSQSCLPNGILFTTQEQIDNFQTDNPDCIEIEGDVYISDTEISNLEGLNVLNLIGGSLNITANNIVSMVGLHNLVTIGGNFELSSNVIVDLTGLESLAYIGGHFYINYCSAVTNLNGLDNLTTIEGEFLIMENSSLISLTGLQSFTNVSVGLYVFGNPSLSSLIGLENVSFSGYLEVTQNESLSTIVALENLTSFGSELTIYDNDALTNLAGLENITSVGHSLIIGDNDALTNLDELDNLTSVGFWLYVMHNDALTNINGLININSVPSILNIRNNASLVNLDGLNNLIYVGNDVRIRDNILLSDISGINNLTTIDSSLIINNNSSLTTMEGLNENLTIGGNIQIEGNTTLSICAIESICNYLTSPNGEIIITDNASGCNNQEEVEEDCGTSSSCLPEGITFTTQEQIDNFQTDNPGCAEIEGVVQISGYDITNLLGLNMVTSINDLSIESNPLLSNLEGLESLIHIDETLNISGNAQLSSLLSLENLEYIGGDLAIGNPTVSGNDQLENLNGLQGIASIGHWLLIIGNQSLIDLNGLSSLSSISPIDEGIIQIEGNPEITSLYGLEGIEPNTIETIWIQWNQTLSICDIESICEYLLKPDVNPIFSNNASGCNSQQEVEEACGIVSINGLHLSDNMTTFPSPFTTLTTIEYTLKQPSTVQLSIFNQLGQLVYQHAEDQTQGTQQLQWKAEGQPEGLYYYQLLAGDQMASGKMVKVR